MSMDIGFTAKRRFDISNIKNKNGFNNKIIFKKNNNRKKIKMVSFFNIKTSELDFYNVFKKYFIHHFDLCRKIYFHFNTIIEAA